MKKSGLIVFAGVLTFAACSEAPKKETTSIPTVVAEVQKVLAPTLTDAETVAGVKLLFNGQNTEGWHVYQKDSTVHWEIKDGILSTKGGHNDLVTNAEYDNFELGFDWKVGKAGNSGVLYMVQEGDTSISRTWHTGIEYQLIDDKGWVGELHASQKPAAAYDLYDPKVLAANDAGTWNTARILSNKGHIQHFLNGQLIVDYMWNSPDFKARVAKSKFKDMPFAQKAKGHIAVQDHGQEVALRNIKIKEL